MVDLNASATWANPAAPPPPKVRSSLMMKVFGAFAALAVLSGAIGAAGHWLGRSIAMSGHTDDTTTREIIIGNDVVVAASNEIRFARQRRNGVATRIDLYFRWPEMDGYSEATRTAFNHSAGSKRILFLSMEPRMMSRDMSGRFDPIYRSLIVATAASVEGDVSIHDFMPRSGYVNELLAVAPRRGQAPFVARCLGGPSSVESLAPCERDVQVGRGLSLSYRFPRELLPEWESLEAAILFKAATMIKAGE